MTRNAATRLTVQAMDGAMGAEVRGLDLAAPLSARTRAALAAAFAVHILLVFREQQLTPQQQLAFTAALGPVHRVPYVEGLAECPDVIAVTKEASETNISVFGGQWHSDFSFLPRPPAASLLYAREVPATGGDTSWTNQYLAYETLPAPLRARIETWCAIHSGWPYGARSTPDPDSTSRSIRMTRGDPDADREQRHPVVRTHPVTGRRALFVNPIYTLRLEGMPERESRALLAELFAHATRPELGCRLRWRRGTLALWDNRCSLHCADNDYDGQRREMHRTSIAGEVPHFT